MDGYRRRYPTVHTDRQYGNRYYAERAIAILGLAPHADGSFPEPNWLVDWPGADRGKKGAIKWGVLTELGRLSEARIEAKMIVALAHVVSQERLTVKDAEQRLRNWRLTKIASSPTS